MARHRKSLESLLADNYAQGKADRSAILETPALEVLGPEMIADLAINAEHLADNAVQLDKLEETLQVDVSKIPTMGEKLDQTAADLVVAETKINVDLPEAINQASISPVTDARLSAGSLTTWPFTNGTVPQGALAPGAVTQDEIADFSLVAKKFNTNRHILY